MFVTRLGGFVVHPDIGKTTKKCDQIHSKYCCSLAQAFIMETLLKGLLSTVDLFELTCLDQLLFILKNYLHF